MDLSILNTPACDAAKRLLGCELERTVDDEKTMRVKIVETEAYDSSDASSHSFNGQTPRNRIMFGPAGHLYVYFTYGMHYCCNIVTGQEGDGSAVLIRAVEPLVGKHYMLEKRNVQTDINLSNGPAKLCQALAIDRTMNGHDLSKSPLKLIIKPPIDADSIVQTTRIGISKAKDTSWRFYISDNQYVSN